MHYLDFSIDFEDLSYLLGIVSNSKGGKTIIFSMIYDENYQNIYNDEEKISYIIMIETNYFFRNRGIFKIALNYVKELFKDNDIVLVSLESSMGSKISLRQRIIDSFDDTDVEVRNCEDAYSLVRRK